VRTKCRQEARRILGPGAAADEAHVALAIDVRRAPAELSEGDRRLLSPDIGRT
jgi:hypothetical protein